ncbi:10477_t:CDS:2, partial [Scutellospora calospora]
MNKIEAGEYYDEKYGRRNRTPDNNIDQQNQQMQVLYASFEKLTTTLATYIEFIKPQTTYRNNNGNYNGDRNGNNNNKPNLESISGLNSRPRQPSNSNFTKAKGREPH